MVRIMAELLRLGLMAALAEEGEAKEDLMPVVIQQQIKAMLVHQDLQVEAYIGAVAAVALVLLALLVLAPLMVVLAFRRP